MTARGSGAAWSSVVTGLAAVATLPLAVYLTRFSSGYELLHAGFAIPLAVILGAASLLLARRARLRGRISLGAGGSPGVARVGRALGILGLCMAAAALVALGVYGLLEYVGSRG